MILFVVVFFVLGFRYVYVPYAVRHSSEKYNFETLPLPKTPNFYLLCPEDRCKSKKAEVAVSPTYNIPREALEKQWSQMIATQARTTLLESDLNNHQRTYVHYSAFWRFPDIINVKFIELGESHSSFYIMSASLMGHSDFGVNKKRTTQWVNAL